MGKGGTGRTGGVDDAKRDGGGGEVSAGGSHTSTGQFSPAAVSHDYRLTADVGRVTL